MEKEKQNLKKEQFLGMPLGTAFGRLKKIILFHLLKKHNENFCHRCQKEILTEKELSIEHKTPWLYNDIGLFWDMDNIAFSHLSCNAREARRPNKGKITHPSVSSYRKGCRCNECKNIEKLRRRNQRARGIDT